MQVFFLFSSEMVLGIYGMPRGRTGSAVGFGCLLLRLCTVGHVAFSCGYGASMPLL